MIKQLICLLLFLICISCTSKPKEVTAGMTTENSEKEINSISLKGELLSCDSTMWGVKIVDKIGDYFIMQSNHNNPVFWVYKLEGDLLIEQKGFLTHGEGPFEMIQPYAVYDKRMDKLFLYDFVNGLKSMYSIKLDDITNLYNTSTWQKLPLPDTKGRYWGASLCAINDSALLVLGSRFYSQNLFSYIDLSKKSLQELNYSYPKNDGTFNVEAIVKQNVYMDAVIVKHPSLSKIVYACGSGRYADILQWKDTLLTDKIPLFSIYPKYTTRDGLNKSYDEECLRGMQVAATDEAIYIQFIPLTKGDVRKQAQYKGYPNYYNDELIVFNWDGEVLGKYLLDIPIYSCVVDEMNKVLYGMSMDLDSGNPIIVRYNLKSFG